MHVPSQLGEWMGLPHLIEVVGCELQQDGTLDVRKKMDENYMDFQVKLPAVIAVSKSINTVRYPNIRGIMAAKKKPLTVFSCAELDDLDPALAGMSGSPTRNGELKEFSFSRNCEELTGTPEEIAQTILAKLRATGISF